jgi:hypothetical protein
VTVKLVPVHKIHASAFIEPGTEVEKCTLSAVTVQGVVVVAVARFVLGPVVDIAPDEFASTANGLGAG